MDRILQEVIAKKEKALSEISNILENGNGKKFFPPEKNLEDSASFLLFERSIREGLNTLANMAINIRKAIKIAKLTDGKCPFCGKMIEVGPLENNIPTCSGCAKKHVKKNMLLEEFYKMMLEKIRQAKAA